MSAFVTSIPEDYTPSTPKERTADAAYRRDASQTQKRETEMRLLREKQDSALRDVIALELQMGLNSTSRWTPATPKFIETAQFLAERDYHLALERLQHLVVQRLFELHTMNISHTGKQSYFCCLDAPLTFRMQPTKFIRRLRSHSNGDQRRSGQQLRHTTKPLARSKPRGLLLTGAR